MTPLHARPCGATNKYKLPLSQVECGWRSIIRIYLFRHENWEGSWLKTPYWRRLESSDLNSQIREPLGMKTCKQGLCLQNNSSATKQTWCLSTSLCVFAGSGAAPGTYAQSQQPPTGSTTPSHQHVIGLAQAQANNSNNKRGTSVSLQESSLPEDLQQLMEDWAQEVLIVTQGSRSNSLSISRQQLWEQVIPPKHGLHAGALDVSQLSTKISYRKNIKWVV